MSFLDELRLDLEAALPFQFFALLIWPSGLLELMRDLGDGTQGVLLFTGGMMLLAQPMLLIRTLRGDTWRHKGANLLANELYLLTTLLLVFSLQTLGPRRTFSPELEARRRSREVSLHLPRADAPQRPWVG